MTRAPYYDRRARTPRPNWLRGCIEGLALAIGFVLILVAVELMVAV